MLSLYKTKAEKVFFLVDTGRERVINLIFCRYKIKIL